MLRRAVLFLAVFAPSVLLLNTEMLPTESEAKPLVIAGAPDAAEAETLSAIPPARASVVPGRLD